MVTLDYHFLPHAKTELWVYASNVFEKNHQLIPMYFHAEFLTLEILLHQQAANNFLDGVLLGNIFQKGAINPEFPLTGIDGMKILCDLVFQFVDNLCLGEMFEELQYQTLEIDAEYFALLLLLLLKIGDCDLVLGCYFFVFFVPEGLFFYLVYLEFAFVHISIGQLCCTK